MKKLTFLGIALAALVSACGGGGDNAGKCSGSPQWCAEFAPGAGTAGINTGSNTSTNTTTNSALFSKSGSGDTVFDIPASVTKIRIQGTTTERFSLFYVAVADSMIVRATVGTGETPQGFDGTYLLKAGGVVQITGSQGVAWTFTEVK